jgi:MFS family permease
MTAGLALLILAYVLSQFFRAFLAVLAPVLGAEIGATPADLAFASGVWFLVFAAMQFPVGWALDRIGPRRTVAWLMGLFAGGGALAFAASQTPAHLTLAMALIGVGCSPVLMAAYTIFARSYPAAAFATLAAGIVGIGSLGNILGSAPLAWAVAAWGWRETLAGLAGLTGLTALALGLVLRDPAPAPGAAEARLSEVLGLRTLWPVFAMMFVSYAPAAGLRGLWAGPWAAGIHAADKDMIGHLTLAMGLAMVLGNLAIGPLDRWLGRRKALILACNLGVAALCLVLAAAPTLALVPGGLVLALIGLLGATFGIVVAHGRAFVPAHLTGRGVAMLNLFGIMGVALGQFATGRLYAAADGAAAGLSLVFLWFGATTLAGCLIYLWSQDRNG